VKSDVLWLYLRGVAAAAARQAARGAYCVTAPSNAATADHLQQRNMENKSPATNCLFKK
jgi:hypothetical protein